MAEPNGSGALETIGGLVIGAVGVVGGWAAALWRFREKRKVAAAARSKDLLDYGTDTVAQLFEQVKLLVASQQEDRASIRGLGGEVAVLKGQLAVAEGKLEISEANLETAHQIVARLEAKNAELVTMYNGVVSENHKLQELNRELRAERRNDMQIAQARREQWADEENGEK